MKGKYWLLLTCCWLSSLSVLQADEMNIVHLRCEYKTDPVGIDVLQPRLSWQISSSRRNVRQSAYQIQVTTSLQALEKGESLTWDSGKISTDQSHLISYTGPALQSRQRYYWRVKVWDEKEKPASWSKANFWEMALLNTADWQAEWIAADIAEDVSKSPPAPLLRREFKLNAPIRQARVYITAHGLYEAYINGQKVGDEVFTPGWTSYHNRLQYQTYDISDLVKTGDNAIGVMLGDGWYRGNIGFRGQRNFYGKQLALLVQIEVTYEDGRREVIGSDQQWKSSLGPILFSDIYNGESYDARQEKSGWSKTAYSNANWSKVRVMPHSKNNLIASYGPPIRQLIELTPKAILKTPDGKTVVDMGQNMVGRVRLNVKGPAGTVLKIHHAEVLDKEGYFYTENLRYAKQQVQYILKGEGEEVYEPIFSFQGFRYVMVEGYPGTLTKDKIKGIVIYSDMPISGDFECSEPLINQLQHNIQWGQRGNFLDIPTDCPQRDERLGWTGDAQAFSRTAAFNMDVAGFFTKWLADLSADQLKDGRVPWVIPHVLGPDAAASTGWADAVTIVPWNTYLVYGDRGLLAQQYKSMKAWVAYMEKEAGKDYLWNTGAHFGDWLFYSVNDDRDGKSAITDKYFIAQAFFAHSTNLVLKTAKVLGHTDDVAYYSQLLKEVKKAFREEYITPNGRLVSSTQTAYVLALLFDLFPEERREAAAQRLVQNIARYNNHLTTGFLGTPHLCHILTQYGYLDLAYELLQQETYPSWLYPVKMGATTIWERWDGIKPDSTFQSASMNSFNHYAYGAIGDWMYRVIAGIEIDETAPGYKKVIIKPRPGGTLQWAKAYHQSPYGKISSFWRLENNQFHLEVEIPANTTAKIYLPDAQLAEVLENGKALNQQRWLPASRKEKKALVLLLGSGKYHFSYPAGALRKNPNNQ